MLYAVLLAALYSAFIQQLLIDYVVGNPIYVVAVKSEKRINFTFFRVMEIASYPPLVYPPISSYICGQAGDVLPLY
jgi:hypothetical protein